MLTLWLCTPKTTPAPKTTRVVTSSSKPLSWFDRLMNKLCGFKADAVTYHRRE